jgi:hypothetical protein
MSEEDISTAEGAYTYLTGIYKEAAPNFYEYFLKIGTKRMVRSWLEEEEISLPPGEEAKFMKMLDQRLNLFERKNSFPLLLNLPRAFLLATSIAERKKKEEEEQRSAEYWENYLKDLKAGRVERTSLNAIPAENPAVTKIFERLMAERGKAK